VPVDDSGAVRLSDGSAAAEPVPAVPVAEPAATSEPVASPPKRAAREGRAPTVEPSQVLAMTLSERIARGRPPSSETA
jgi:hypothetical protein